MSRAPTSARRRRLLAGGAAALATAGAWPARGLAAPPAPSTPRRIVVLNWELAETLLALGRVPVGLPLPDWYTRTIVAPPLPRGVVDVGLLYQPNFSVLLALAPDLLIVTPGHAGLLTPLHHIAPTLTLGAYMSAADPYAQLCAETLTMADALGARPRALELIDATRRAVASIAARLRARPDLTRTPVLVAEALDDRHLRVYGAGSLFDALLAQLGVANAVHPRDADPRAAGRWATNALGSAVVPLTRLADVPRASLLLVGPPPADSRAALMASPLWRALPVVQARRVAVLPVIAPYGGLVSMQRFAQATEHALATLAARGDDHA